MTTDPQARVRAEVARLWEVARAEFPILKHHSTPAVFFDVRGRAAGRAKRNGGLCSVHFNPILLHENEEYFLSHTVPHEVAHLLDYIVFNGWGHNSSWKACCAALGMEEITRCHSLDTSNSIVRVVSRHEVSCGCAGTRKVSAVIHNRMLRGSHYRCNACGKRLELKKVEFSSCTPESSC